MPRPQAREAGCVWTAGGQRLQVVVQGTTVAINGIALTLASRVAFVRAFFLACAEADDYAEREEFSRLYFEAERQAEANAERMQQEATMPP